MLPTDAQRRTQSTDSSCDRPQIRSGRRVTGRALLSSADDHLTLDRLSAIATSASVARVQAHAHATKRLRQRGDLRNG
eukprot:5505608-Prymnesium_polylepis.1